MHHQPDMASTESMIVRRSSVVKSIGRFRAIISDLKGVLYEALLAKDRTPVGVSVVPNISSEWLISRENEFAVLTLLIVINR
jgi:hypothetical protein